MKMFIINFSKKNCFFLLIKIKANYPFYKIKDEFDFKNFE